MKKNFDIRLAALREYLKSLLADETTCLVEGGGNSFIDRIKSEIDEWEVIS